MTGKSLFSRLAWLGVVLLCAGALHLALTLKTESIARAFGQTYSPLAKEVAKKQAVDTCERERDRMPWLSKDCSMPSESDIAMQVRRHEENYEYSTLRPVEEKVRDVTNFALGTVYATLALAGLWAVKIWFVANIWHRIAGFVEPLQTSINLSEMGAARRLRRAEAEFRTLKNLRDDGLITEDVFVARKNKLKAALKVGQISKL